MALILRKATELAGRSDVDPVSAADLSLAEIKEIGAEVGIDPAFIEQAAHLVPRREAESRLERLIGGPVHHRVEARFPIALTHGRATHLLSAVRAEIGKHGQGQADSAGISWHSEPGIQRVSVTAHSDQDGTTVRVGVDRTSMIVPVSIFTLFAIIGWVFVVLEDIQSLGDMLDWLLVSAGSLVIARALWASSTRAIEERTTALLDAVSRSLADPGGESDDE